MLTTNSAERYHNQWGNYFGTAVSNPSLYKCLRMLEAQQVLTNKVLAERSTGRRPADNKSQELRVKQLQTLVSQYDADKKSQDLLRGVARVYMKV